MSSTDVLFIADQYDDSMRSAEDNYVGGAERTDSVILRACPHDLVCRRASEVSDAEIAQAQRIVIGNLSHPRAGLIDAICKKGRHILFEHDLRICKWRGNFPASKDYLHFKHQRCWCASAQQKRLFGSALGVIFLTQRQRQVYNQNPFFKEPANAVLGCSVFGETLLDQASGSGPRQGACILGSKQNIKGTNRARRYCLEHGMTPTLIEGMTPAETYEVFRRSELFVYLPEGLEPAGRMPVEARLLGCDVIVNRHLGVAGEPWWQSERDEAVAFLRDAPLRFWRLVDSFRAPAHEQRPPGGLNWRAHMARAALTASSILHSKFLARDKADTAKVMLAEDLERLPAWVEKPQ